MPSPTGTSPLFMEEQKWCINLAATNNPSATANFRKATPKCRSVSFEPCSKAIGKESSDGTTSASSQPTGRPLPYTRTARYHSTESSIATRKRGNTDACPMRKSTPLQTNSPPIFLNWNSSLRKTTITASHRKTRSRLHGECYVTLLAPLAQLAEQLTLNQ